MTEEVKGQVKKKRRRFFPSFRKEEPPHCDCVPLEQEAEYILARAELTKASTQSWFTKFIAAVITLVIIFIVWVIVYPSVFGGEPQGLETIMSLATFFKDIIVSILKVFV